MPFGSLWLPVIVSTVVVFVLSALAHMVLRYHRSDVKELPNEEAVAEAIRKGGAARGVYVLPYCGDPSRFREPAIRKKFEDGPVAFLTVMPKGPPRMAKNLVQWTLLCFLVSFTAAYAARHTLSYAADGLTVMRITGTLAFAGYGFGCFQNSIWEGIPWANSLRGLADAAVYAVATGLVFRLLWPSA